MPTLLDRWLAKKKPIKATPLKAIRMKCLDCCGNNQAEVRRCVVWTCPIWSYRMGHRGKPPPTWIHPDDQKIEEPPEEPNKDEEEAPLGEEEPEE